MENNNQAMQRPGSAASMTPEITESKEIKETENKAPLQDIDSPFKAVPYHVGVKENKTEPGKSEQPAKAAIIIIRESMIAVHFKIFLFISFHSLIIV